MKQKKTKIDKYKINDRKLNSFIFKLCQKFFLVNSYKKLLQSKEINAN